VLPGGPPGYPNMFMILKEVIEDDIMIIYDVDDNSDVDSEIVIVSVVISSSS